MKKFFKVISSLALAVFVALSVTACKTPLSKTTVSDEKSIVNNVSTNGGTTAIYGDYLYFINGTKTNDGTASRGTTQGAICRVKYDVQEGKLVENAEVEVVVSDLAGYEDGSINIFGDFLYFATPNNEVNRNGDLLYYKTDFKRLDLVYGTVQTIYTTGLNNSSENVSYAYYFVGDELYLLVYEDVSMSLTSVKVDSVCEVAYKISDVTSCVFSDDFGKSENSGVVDANNFVFYTKTPKIQDDGFDEGSKVFKTSPNVDNSEWLGNTSSDGRTHNKVSILSIKNGKFVYSEQFEIGGDECIYAQTMGENTKLEFNQNDIISYKTYGAADDMILFDEQDDGSISILAYNSSSYHIAYIEKNAQGENIPHTMLNLGVKTDLDFVGMATVKDIEKDGEGQVIKSDTVEYLIYTVTSSSKVTLYKLEIKRNGVLATSPNLEVIANDNDGMVAMNGLIAPEAIGNNLFVMLNYENEDDENDTGIYMHIVDISKEVDDEDNKLDVLRKK